MISFITSAQNLLRHGLYLSIVPKQQHALRLYGCNGLGFVTCFPVQSYYYILNCFRVKEGETHYNLAHDLVFVGADRFER